MGWDKNCGGFQKRSKWGANKISYWLTDFNFAYELKYNIAK